MNVTTARQILIDAISEPVERQTRPHHAAGVSVDPKQVADQAVRLERLFVQSGIGIAEEVQNRAEQPYTGPGTKRNIK